MCNPNSSIASRRQRVLALQAAASKSSSVLTPNILAGSIFRSRVRIETTIDHSTDFTPPVSNGGIFNNSSFMVPTRLSVLQRYQFGKQEEVPQPSKPKRRRKPQKPGKTAKQNDRHFVIHNYNDHANDIDDHVESLEPDSQRRGGVSASFPLKLHAVLDLVEADGLAHVISWQPHGRCFSIHKPKEFTDYIMPNYFRQTKLTSFQRQLNLYGFNRLTRGDDRCGYYNELFLRGKPFLCKHMVRTKVKGTRFKAASSPDQEPDFYSMPPVVVTPNSSDCGNSDHDSGHEEGNVQPELQGTHHQYHVSSPVAYRSTVPVLPQEPQVPDMAPLPYDRSYPFLPLALPPPMVSSHVFCQAPRNPAPEFVDETLEELFLSKDSLPEVNECILDFVNIWDVSYGTDAALENDTQLGNLLDKLLED